MNKWQLDKVEQQFLRAKADEDKARKDHERASMYLDKIKKAVNCSHPIEKLSGEVLLDQNIERCEECGYEWYY